jgi:hypothetical protein
LNQRIEEFNKQGLHFLNLDDDTTVQLDENDGEVEEEVEDDEDNDASVTEQDEDVSSTEDEAINLLLPSNIWNESSHGVLEEVRLMEMDFRKGQANDALEGLRESLGYKSMLMVTKVS